MKRFATGTLAALAVVACVAGGGEGVTTVTCFWLLVTRNQEPVTTISWRDAMVWMNALTEYDWRNYMDFADTHFRKSGPGGN